MTGLKSWWQSRWFYWLKKRRTVATKLTLDRKNTFIFPTRYGFLLMAMIFVMAVGAANYQNNLIYLITFFVIAQGLVSILATFYNLAGITLVCHQPDAVFMGQKAHYLLSIGSEKSHRTLGIGFAKGVVEFFDLDSDKDLKIELTQPCDKRGYVAINPICCQSIYPLGFVRAWSWLFFDMKCLVYPKPIAPDDVELAQIPKDSMEYSDLVNTGGEELYGLRNYQMGDLMSRIHWKSYAKEKGLFTREFVEYKGQPGIFSYDDFSGVEKERRLSHLCYLLLQAYDNDESFGLRLPNQLIAVGNGHDHLVACLTALALFK